MPTWINLEYLSAEPWVERIDREATVLRLTVRDEQRARRELPQLIAGLGEQLVRYQQARPTIEDVFVRLVEA